MLSVIPPPSRFMTAIFTLLIATPFALRTQAQDSNGKAPTPYIDDWSHHRLVFSNPDTREDAVKNGKLEEWNRITNDPRYQLQHGRREHRNRQVPDGSGGEPGSGNSYDHHGHDGGGNPLRTKTESRKTGASTSALAALPPTKATLTGTFSALPTTTRAVNPDRGRSKYPHH